MMKRPIVAAALLAGLLTSAARAAERVDVVVGKDAPKLERFAAKELSEQFKKLFDADVVIAESAPKKSKHLILIGSPKTNPAVKAAMGKDWPKLSDQGHIVKSVKHDGRTVLIVGGGSPVATLWAVYELGYQFGIRYLLDRDAYPVDDVKLRVDGFDVKMEPSLRLRTWSLSFDSKVGPGSWGLTEHRQLVRQLAKLKFNRLLLVMREWQPFVHYEHKGAKKSDCYLWDGRSRIRVDGETAGRAAFRGAKYFENPDFVGKATYKQKLEAGKRLARGILQTSRELGMSTAIGVSLLEFFPALAPALPGAKAHTATMTKALFPGPKLSPRNPVLMHVVRAKISAYLKTYPDVDALYLDSQQKFARWEDYAEEAWKRLATRAGAKKLTTLKKLTDAARKHFNEGYRERYVVYLHNDVAVVEFVLRVLDDAELLKLPNGRRAQVTLKHLDPALAPIIEKLMPPNVSVEIFISRTARRIVKDPRGQLRQAPPTDVATSLDLPLRKTGIFNPVVPWITVGHLDTIQKALRKNQWDGFTASCKIVSDQSPSAHFLSRASFDPAITSRTALEHLISPMCGKEVYARVQKAFAMIEKANDLMDENHSTVTCPESVWFEYSAVASKYIREKPPPKWWAEARDLYLNAMNEMYRANTRARMGGRHFTLDFARRFEHAYHYFNCLEATRLAGIAKSKGNKKEQAEQLEKAVEAMHDSLDALSAVARNNCDRGVIAVLNEYGYRPLLKELRKLDDE